MLHGGGNQSLSGTGTHLTQDFVVDADGGTAAGNLQAHLGVGEGAVHGGHGIANALRVYLQLLGDQSHHARHHTLPHFRLGNLQDDGAIGLDAQESIRLEVRLTAELEGFPRTRGKLEAQRKSTTGHGDIANELASGQAHDASSAAGCQCSTAATLKIARCTL